MSFIEDSNRGLPPEKATRTRRRTVARWYGHADDVRFGGIIAELNKPQRGILLWMWAAADRRTGRVQGGYSLIGQAIGIDRQDVKRQIKGLIARGILRRVHVGSSKADRTVWELLRIDRREEDNRRAEDPTDTDADCRAQDPTDEDGNRRANRRDGAPETVGSRTLHGTQKVYTISGAPDAGRVCASDERTTRAATAASPVGEPPRTGRHEDDPHTALNGDLRQLRTACAVQRLQREAAA